MDEMDGTSSVEITGTRRFRVTDSHAAVDDLNFGLTRARVTVLDDSIHELEVGWPYNSQTQPPTTRRPLPPLAAPCRLWPTPRTHTHSPASPSLLRLRTPPNPRPQAGTPEYDEAVALQALLTEKMVQWSSR